MSFPLFLSACVGFLSLSQEILWVRYLSYAHQSVPQAFAYVLAVFLLGIAAGAALGKRLCAGPRDLVLASAAILALAALLDAVAPIGIAALPLASPVLLLSALAIFLCAMLKGAIFPIAHHLGAASKQAVGTAVSRVYFCNIIGATLGPLVTGYVLLDRLGLQAAMLVLAGLTALLAAACAAKARSLPALLAGAGSLAVAAGCAALQETVVYGFSAADGRGFLGRVIENRSGIIYTLHGPGGDMVYGGNVYDGRMNIDLRVNSNDLHRVLVLAALRPQARDMLVVGLAGGAWTRVLADFPEARRIDVVEINPGYLELIADYPEIRPILADPRIHIEVDDGRRWLKRHAGRQYDLIVMNTTWHWRSYSSNLLSREFLTLMKSHLRPGGVVTYNATGSTDVLATANTVFKHAYRYENFIVASDDDFRARTRGAEPLYRSFKRNGRPLFEPGNSADDAFIRRMLEQPFVSLETDEAKLGRKAEVITDWNMITEYRYGRRWP